MDSNLQELIKEPTQLDQNSFEENPSESKYLESKICQSTDKIFSLNNGRKEEEKQILLPFTVEGFLSE